MKRILVIFLLISCSLSNLTFAKVSDSLIVEDLSFKTARIQENFREVEGDIQKLKKDVKENTENIEEHDFLYKNWKWILSLLAIFGFFGYANIKELTRRMIDKVVTEHSEILNKIINQVIDNSLTKKNAKVLIMGKEITNLKIQVLLKSNGFTSVEVVNNFDESDKMSEYALIILTDYYDLKEENETKINELILKNAMNQRYFYFGKWQVKSDIMEDFNYKVSSSKFPSQIIGNITNLLNYK